MPKNIRTYIDTLKVRIEQNYINVQFWRKLKTYFDHASKNQHHSTELDYGGNVIIMKRKPKDLTTPSPLV
jgi:hypothetical protein